MAKDNGEPTLRDVLKAIKGISDRVEKLETAHQPSTAPAETIYSKGVAADPETGVRSGCSHVVYDLNHPHGKVPFGHFGSEGDAQSYVSAMRQAGHKGLVVEPV